MIVPSAAVVAMISYWLVWAILSDTHRLWCTCCHSKVGGRVPQWQVGGQSCVLVPSQAARLAQLRHLHLAGGKFAAPLQEQHEPRLGGGGSKGQQGQQQGQSSLGHLLPAGAAAA